MLDEGEIRVEFNEIRLNELGQAKLNSLISDRIANDMVGGAVGDALASIGALGAMTASALSGDVMALVKVQLPGDPLLVSDPVRLGRGPVGRPTKLALSKRSYHAHGSDNPRNAERARAMVNALASKNPVDSLMRVTVVLADSTGKEVEGAEVGAFECSFKELIQDVPPDDHGTYEIKGEIELFGIPPPKEKKPSSQPAKPALGSSASCSSLKRSCTSFSLTRSKTLSSSDFAAGLASSGSGRSLIVDKLERPVSMGRLLGRIAIKPIVFLPSQIAEANAHQELAEKARSATKLFRKSAQIVPIPADQTAADAAWTQTLKDSGALDLVNRSSCSPDLQALHGVTRATASLHHVKASEPAASSSEVRARRPLPAYSEMVEADAEIEDHAEAKVEAERVDREHEPPPELPETGGEASSFSDAPLPAWPSEEPLPTDAPAENPPKRAPALLATVTSMAAADDNDDESWTPRLIQSQLQSGRLPSYSLDAADSPQMLPSEPPTAPPTGLGSLTPPEQLPPASPPTSPPDSPSFGAPTNFSLLARSMKNRPDQSSSLVYTVAYWVLWKTVETIGDQRLLFGDSTNQPVLVRNNKLGVLVNNEFHATEYDPRWAGDNWQLVVACNDGAYSKLYIGHASNDDSGAPDPAKAEEPSAGRPISDDAVCYARRSYH